VNGTEQDREHLKKLGILPSQLRNRPITMIRARNLFRIFGHKVIRRGRPVRDDYHCNGMEEPSNFDLPAEEEEPSYGVYDLKMGASLEGGPYRRHGLSLLGFGHRQENFEPKDIELEKDSWIYKCARSAAEFNHRLNRNRPISFLDLHTNTEQIAKGTQPTRVIVERNIDDNGDVLKIDTDVVCSPKDSKWVPIGSNEPTTYPLAIMRNQYQDQVSLFPFRFKESDAEKAIVTNRLDMDQAAGLFGVQPFQPTRAPAFRDDDDESEWNGD
jgi:hypothetical protein